MVLYYLWPIVAGLTVFGVAIYYVLRLQKAYSSDLSILNQFFSLLQGIKKENIHIDHHLATTRIEKEVSDRRVLDLWVEFEESLVIENDSIHNTLDAGHFFDENSIAPNLFNSETLKAGSSVLVGIGVFITFFGLFIGLFNLQITAEDVSVLRDGIANLISGAATAFVSSIVGVASSIWYGFLERKYKDELRQIISQIQDSINFNYPRTNPEKSLALMQIDARQTEQHLGQLAEKIGDSLQRSLRDLSGEISSGIQKSLEASIGPYLEDITKKAYNSSESSLDDLVDRFIDKVGMAGEEHRTKLEALSKTIENSILELREEMSGEVKALSDTVEKLNHSYHFITENLIDDYNRTIEGLEESLKGYGKSNESMKNALQQYQEYGDKMFTLVHNVSQYSSQLEVLQSRVNKYIESLQITVEKYSGSSAEAIRGSKELTKTVSELSSALQNPLNQLRNEYLGMHNELKQHHQEVLRKTNELLSNLSSQIETQINDRFSQWNTQTYEFSNGMLSVTEQLNALVQEIFAQQKSNGTES